MNTVLLDTSIQIKRLVSTKWLTERNDRHWEAVNPAASLYTWMEFKNSLVAALRFLMSVLEEIASDRKAVGDDAVAIRLSEVIRRLNVETTQRERERRTRLANAYAAKILEEHNDFGRRRSLEEVIAQLTVEATLLEEVLFFQFPREESPQIMETLKTVDCGLGKNESPLRNGRHHYHCRRNGFECNILAHQRKVQPSGVAEAMQQGALRLKDRRLKDGIQAISVAMGGPELNDGRSIGEKLCFPIGDLIIVSEAKHQGVGLFTADTDQISLAKHLSVPFVFFCDSNGQVTRAE